MNRLNYIIKITLYKGSSPDKVAYYRYDFPHGLLSRYRWYFEFLAALVKVHYPREKVELLIKQNTDGFLAGKDYIAAKTKSLLPSLRGQLTRLDAGTYQDDLFGTVTEKNEEKKKRIAKEIADLENGIFTRWVPCTYINRIKEVIQQGSPKF